MSEKTAQDSHEAVEGRRIAASGCIQSLDMCSKFLKSISIYTYRAKFGGNSPIGAHIRHVIEFYENLLNGVNKSETVDYDNRTRGSECESDIIQALIRIENVQKLLRKVAKGNYPVPVVIQESAARDEDPVSVTSHTTRELMFLSHHTIHHLSMMKMLAQMYGENTSSADALAFSTAKQADKTKS